MIKFIYNCTQVDHNKYDHNHMQQFLYKIMLVTHDLRLNNNFYSINFVIMITLL